MVASALALHKVSRSQCLVSTTTSSTIGYCGFASGTFSFDNFVNVSFYTFSMSQSVIDTFVMYSISNASSFMHVLWTTAHLCLFLNDDQFTFAVNGFIFQIVNMLSTSVAFGLAFVASVGAGNMPWTPSDGTDASGTLLVQLVGFCYCKYCSVMKATSSSTTTGAAALLLIKES